MSKEKKANTENTDIEISEELLDQPLKDYHKPKDLLRQGGILKQPTKKP